MSKVVKKRVIKINIDEKSKSFRKYAGRTITLDNQNYKTSKIA
jgi:hypothetical protein